MSSQQRPDPASATPRAQGRVRLEDVAAAAGVSRTSASRVMLGQGKVSEETRRRVLAVADELGYVTNVAASELASGGSSTVGLLLRTPPTACCSPSCSAPPRRPASPSCR